MAVAMGEAKHARRYCGKLAPNLTCLADPVHEVFTDYGLRQGTLREMSSLATMRAGFRALKNGHMQGKTVGDARMLPGTFVVDQNGIIQHAHYSQHPGDHPDITALLKQHI